jgi:hypothetical protein
VQISPCTNHAREEGQPFGERERERERELSAVHKLLDKLTTSNPNSLYIRETEVYKQLKKKTFMCIT